MFLLKRHTQAEAKYDRLKQALVRKMPPKGFGVFGGDPGKHAREKLVPVSAALDVGKQHSFHFGVHPHYSNVFGCESQEQVDTLTKSFLALMSIVADREIPFQQGLHNLKVPVRFCS